MTEISLYMLDLVQNSILAKASVVTITMNEDITHNRLVLTISDNGKGMDEATLQQVTSPFYTTRTTRKVGLGLAFMKELCDACSGSFQITSIPNQETTLEAVMQYDHIDRPELGQIAESLYSLMLQEVRIIYHHYRNNYHFRIDSEEIRTILGDVSLAQYDVMRWIKEYITEQIAQLTPMEEL